MTAIDCTAFLEALRTRIPGFNRVYDEHVQDYDGVLPHVLVGEVARFLSDEVRRCGKDSEALRSAMELLEQGMGSADSILQELVAVSFLENLDPRDESFGAIYHLFGSHLREQYEKFEKTTRR